MKSINIKGIIAILLIIVLVAGIVVTGLGRVELQSTLTLKATEKISANELSRSSEIISQRLASAGAWKFDIIQTGSSTLEIRLGEGWDYELAKNLACNKGTLAFYETLTRKELENDDRLFSLLQTDEHQSPIGCVPAAEAVKVNEYLRTSPQSKSCRLVWNRKGDEPRCVYALKLNNGSSPALKGTDVSSIKMERGASDHDYAIGISFKDAAVKTWSTVTERNMNRAIAIVVDDELYYAPVVKSPMNNGVCQLTGNFSDVSYFIALTSHGELPVKFELMR